MLGIIAGGPERCHSRPQPILAGLRKDGGTRYLHLQEDSYGTQAFGIAVKADQRKLMELIDTPCSRWSMTAHGTPRSTQWKPSWVCMWI